MNLIDESLREGYAMAGKLDISVPDERERSQITGKVLSVLRKHQKAAQLASALEAYYVFRRMHAKLGEGIEAATLLGDYFFSVFSGLMLPFQNTGLFDRFSEQLQRNCIESVKNGKEIDMDEYLVFVETVCGHLVDSNG